MGRVIVNAVVSLDGFVADVHDNPGPLFDWYENGPVDIAPGDPARHFHVSTASAAYLKLMYPAIGAAVIGRRLFDIVDGWEGRPAAGDHVFVVTHEPPADWLYPDAPFTFVTDGVASAIDQAIAFAGDRDVCVTAGNLAGQALTLGRIDELRMDVAPVVMGTGIRYFGDYDGAQLLFDDPEIVRGDRVTHLRYRLTA